MADNRFKKQISAHLKTVRGSKGLSLDSTAKCTGVSKAMLGQIERGESSPTIATLWKIASGLETSFSAFFADEVSNLGSSGMTFPQDPKMRVKTLFPFQSETRIEVFEIVISGLHQQDSSPHEHGVIEHIHILQGQLELRVSDECVTLNEGDSYRFYADQPHSYIAMTEAVTFHDIISYPVRS
ncbi:XRE family transcriptional regulator [Vibrio sp. FNV 38]|nr:XRE family transcriptional regulator [Vibrio sp. FNV 38]